MPYLQENGIEKSGKIDYHYTVEIVTDMAVRPQMPVKERNIYMNEIIFDRISQMERYATKQEKVIIQFLRTHPVKEMVLMSITEFSEQAGVGDATMLRFCRKLGLKGYSEFRFLLSQSSGETSGSVENDADEALGHMVAALRSSHEMLNQGEVRKAVDMILSARQLYALGSGNSGLAAQEFCNKVLRYGLLCHCWTDAHFQTIAASLMESQDVMILFSVSGGTKDMVDIAKHAAQLGVRLVIVTNYVKSPLAKYADALLCVAAKNAPLDSGSLISKVSQLYAIEVLTKGIRRKMGSLAESGLNKTALAVMDKEI